MENHLKEYQLLETLNYKFKAGDKVLGTIYGAGVKDLIIYTPDMKNRNWVEYSQVKQIETHEN